MSNAKSAKKKGATAAAEKAPVKPAQTDRKTSGGPSDATLNRDLLYSMILQRRFEERCGEMYSIGKIGGFCHLYIGQEAVSSGVIMALRHDDYIITTYRDHGQALV